MSILSDIDDQPYDDKDEQSVTAGPLRIDEDDEGDEVDGVEGKLGRPILRPDGPIFDNITVSFQRWSAPYGAKHVGGIPFDMMGRTFRIA
ncbi:hypothetical protein COL940_014372 [Colletotrichum noveboracense]|nr:hypothetical protein COL940_014372 [Colletotrichum noveboracense]